MMKSVKKVIYVVMIILCLNVINSYASTKVEITAEYLNIRSEMSIDSTIVGVLTTGNICDLLEEENGWYKVSYNNMTGYISIKYANKIESESSKDEDDEIQEEVEEEIIQEDIKNEDTIETNSQAQTQIVKSNTGSLNTECTLKITPLINSSDLKDLSMGQEIVIVSSVNEWSYIYVDNYSGWVRTDAITFDMIEIEEEEQEEEEIEEESQQEVEEEPNVNENKEEELTSVSKTVYTSSLYVNLRKEPSTSGSVIMTVNQNTKLTVIAETEEWYKVSTSKGECYVHKELVSDSITKLEE